MSRGPLVCPECGGHYRNKYAHYEECPGPVPHYRFTGRYQCRRCLDTAAQGGLCACGGRREPVLRTVSPNEEREACET